MGNDVELFIFAWFSGAYGTSPPPGYHRLVMSTNAAHKRVQVCIRVRPPPSSKGDDQHRVSADSVVVNAQEKTVSVVTNAASGAGTCFHFDHVLGRATNQADVYAAAAAPIVDSVLSGYNGTIMAYGQTGAGKTFTMSGTKKHFDDRGICARAISSIFQHIQRDSDHSFVVRVSYVEVYNETLYDLLTFNESQPHSTNASSSTNNREDLVIQENDKGQTFVRGLTRPIVKSEEDAFDLLFQGETNRTIAEHCLNASSTRSHCIFTVYIERRANPDADVEGDDPTLSSSVAVFSKLHLVDLAGSERMKKTHVSGVMLKEASHINKSLTFLEQVVIALGDKKRSHIPYRQTPLTNLLKDSLGGNCRTVLVACVWPESSHNDQTLATLKFATRMMRVKTSAIVNAVGTGSSGGGLASQAFVQKYVSEIQRLQDELAMHDTLSGRSDVDYDLKRITSAAARARYREQIELFIRDESTPPVIQNLAQIDQLFKMFRDLYLEQSRVATADPPAAPTSVSRSESRMVRQFRALRADSPHHDGDDRLPLLTRSSTFTSTKQPSEPEADDEKDLKEEEEANNRQPRLQRPAAPATTEAQPPPLSDKELLNAFKLLDNPKPESLLDLDVAKQNLRIAKASMAALGLEVNKLKL
jgi:kinesin family member 6/9